MTARWAEQALRRNIERSEVMSFTEKVPCEPDH